MRYRASTVTSLITLAVLAAFTLLSSATDVAAKDDCLKTSKWKTFTGGTTVEIRVRNRSDQTISVDFYKDNVSAATHQVKRCQAVSYISTLTTTQQATYKVHDELQSWSGRFAVEVDKRTNQEDRIQYKNGSVSGGSRVNCSREWINRRDLWRIQYTVKKFDGKSACAG